MPLKSLLFISIMLSTAHCRTPEPLIKVYVSKPEMGGLVRTQENELILYKDSDGMLALTPSDFEALLSWCGAK